MIKIYRKTTTIKAEQFDGSDEMIEKYDIINTQLASTAIGFEGAYFLPTMEGELRVNIGDWIASGVEDENWAIADDVFKKTYAELPVIPEYVADYIDMLKNNSDVINASIGAIEYGWGSVKLTTWLDENGDTFARAWLDGYQIEED
ncbi:hypothetical protein HOU40_gp143 [Lactobacillus phage Bromius]|uniref:DUF1642 domain-containing protein n=2 Tax=Harbinvirus TaxID=2732970 RepID=A0A3Q8HXA8_9CAUD|nr:hypothetical protein HOS78_gp151 [Lactobacillus phage Bacchae]YP_009814530.1 hypothetical protein HOU40_gp143 [Lactobacillus phage Bromius]AUV59907.1 hypothetical protein [Lactobacillus phage Bacchae]AYH92379.1 hypothetical protein [Lactobacillus phage Bromius]